MSVDSGPPSCDPLILTMRGGFRENAGRPTAFAGKNLESPRAMDFTPEGRVVLADLQERNGLSRSDVIAHLALRHCDALALRPVFQRPGTVFTGRTRRNANVYRIVAPPNVLRKLDALRKRTGKSYSDIGEALVRWYGPREKDWPAVPGPETKKRRRRKRGRR
jgi:hypothetical protein